MLHTCIVTITINLIALSLTVHCKHLCCFSNRNPWIRVTLGIGRQEEIKAGNDRHKMNTDIVHILKSLWTRVHCALNWCGSKNLGNDHSINNM